ncbi:hypothetical protein LV779_25685 [Streptomyces thinghirensis]|nr:hypothetical protein [Streptomyces thinghirensis]
MGGVLKLGVEPDPARFTDAEIRWSVLRSGVGDAAFPPRAPGALHALAAGDVWVRVEVVRHEHVASGTCRIRIGLSDTFLTAGRSISGTGRLDAGEAAAAGPPTDDFDPGMLRVRTDDLDRPPRLVDYRDEPGNRMMQRVTSDALARLLALLAGTAGELVVLRSYLPEAEGEPPPGDAGETDPDAALHAQGRAMRLRHTTLTAPAARGTGPSRPASTTSASTRLRPPSRTSRDRARRRRRRRATHGDPPERRRRRGDGPRARQRTPSRSRQESPSWWRPPPPPNPPPPASPRTAHRSFWPSLARTGSPSSPSNRLPGAPLP